MKDVSIKKGISLVLSAMLFLSMVVPSISVSAVDVVNDFEPDIKPWMGYNSSKDIWDTIIGGLDTDTHDRYISGVPNNSVVVNFSGIPSDRDISVTIRYKSSKDDVPDIRLGALVGSTDWAIQEHIYTSKLTIQDNEGYHLPGGYHELTVEGLSQNRNCLILVPFTTDLDEYVYVPDLNSVEDYLSGKYDFDYSITVNTGGRVIYSLRRNYYSDVSGFTNHSSSDVTKRFEYYSAFVSESTEFEPEYSDGTTGLPNSGLIVDFSENDLESGSNLLLKFNPDGDKSLNSQPSNYNDAAVMLQAVTGIFEGDKFVAKTTLPPFEAYPDSNSYGETYKVPINSENNVVVYRVYPAASRRYDSSNYMSDRFSFSYEFSLEDGTGRVITSCIDDSSNNKSITGNYISGRLNSTDNYIDSYTVYLSDKKGEVPSYTDGGYLDIDFVGDVPGDFSYDDINVSLSLDEDKSYGNAAFGYSKYKTNDVGISAYKGLTKYSTGSVLDYTLYYNVKSYDEWLSDNVQPRIGYGSGREANVLFSSYNPPTWGGGSGSRQKFIPSNIAQFRIVPNSYYYNFNYSINSVNSKYKIEVVSDTEGVSLSEKDGVYTSNVPVSNEGIKVHSLKVSVTKVAQSSEPEYDSGISGLSNWGIMIDESKFLSYSDESKESNLAGQALRIKSLYNGTLDFVKDTYLPISDVSDGMKYFLWTLWTEDGSIADSGIERGVPQGISEDSEGTFYNTDNKYFLARRYDIFKGTNIRNGESFLYLNSGSMRTYFPKITEITKEEYESKSDKGLDFVYNYKYWHVDVEKIETELQKPDDADEYCFKCMGNWWRINKDTAIIPLSIIKPVVNDDDKAPVGFDFTYSVLNGNGGRNELCDLVDTKIWNWSEFTDSGYKVFPDGGSSLNIYNGYASEPVELSSNDVRFSLVQPVVKSSSEYPDHYGQSLDDLLKLYEGLSPEDDPPLWVDKSGNYVGKFRISDVNLGLLITADEIEDKLEGYELPNLSVDLYLRDGSYADANDSYSDTAFFSVFGEVRDGIFYIKKPYANDWSTNVNQRIYAGGTVWDTTGGGNLSSEWKYNIHSHLDENEAIFIIPMCRDFSMAFDYEISTINISKYNIDGVTENPLGNISREVGNNVLYRGSTESIRLSGDPQILNVKFKSVADISKNDIYEEYEKTDVRYLYARLFDYDFGSVTATDGDEIAKQEQQIVDNQKSDFKFLFDPQSNSNSPINTWHNEPYTGIVDSTLSYEEDNNAITSLGVPKFNVSTPFDNLFTVSNDSDDNGNTKESYETKFEFAYNPDTYMYSYNSVLHAASYQEDRNVVLTYLASLGVDNWGMQGAGFFPFNSLSDDGEWGTAEKYNQNTWLVDKSNINYHFGLALGMNFTVPENNVIVNKDGSTSDIIYKFTGDDDVWVFVDDKLVLDLGGIHEALSGSINFTKGTYMVDGYTRNLSDIAGLNYDSSNWAENSKHSVKMYYLERGGTLSNCSMQFNIPVDEEETYHVTYNGNGNDSGTVPTDNTPYFSGDKVTVKNSDIARTNYEFVGWAMDANADPDDVVDSFNIVKDTTLYAIWKPTLKVVYNLNKNGYSTNKEAPVDANRYEAGDMVVVKDGDSLQLILNETEGSYAKFKCWNTSPDGKGVSYNSKDELKMPDSDITLYAQWEFDTVDMNLPETGSTAIWYIIGGAILLIGIGISLKVFKKSK